GHYLGLSDHLAAVVAAAFGAHDVRRLHALALRAGHKGGRRQGVVSAAGVAAGARGALLGYRVLGHLGCSPLVSLLVRRSGRCLSALRTAKRVWTPRASAREPARGARSG